MRHLLRQFHCLGETVDTRDSNIKCIQLRFLCKSLFFHRMRAPCESQRYVCKRGSVTPKPFWGIRLFMLGKSRKQRSCRNDRGCSPARLLPINAEIWKEGCAVGGSDVLALVGDDGSRAIRQRWTCPKDHQILVPLGKSRPYW